MRGIRNSGFGVAVTGAVILRACDVTGTDSGSTGCICIGSRTLIEAALAPYAGLLGQPVTDADISGALSSFDGDVPTPTGDIVGVARTVQTWGDTRESTQILGLDTALSKDELESYGAAAPPGWMYNSISTTDAGMTLVMTRDDGTRVAYVSSADPGDGEPSAEFRVESTVSEMPQPAWLASLPLPEGGDLTLVGEGVGSVAVEFTRAAGGLATATWSFPSEDLEAILAFYAGGVLEQAGFTLVDPDSIVVGTSSFDVTTGPWTGTITVGELIQDEESFTAVQWLLMRP